MKIPSTRLVFDRKHQATKEKKALIQIEVLYEGKKKYMTTGVKVTSDQWSPKMLVVNHPLAEQLRKRIKTVREKIDEYINKVLEEEETWSWAAFDAYVNRMVRFPADRESFFEFLKRYKEERTDIRESTRKTHNKLVNALEEFGKISDYGDLTKANIMLFDDFLRQRHNAHDAGVYNYHKLLQAYINEAIRRDLTNIRNPYVIVKLKKPKKEMQGWLTEEEIEKIATAKMPTQGIDKVRDFAMLQYYTGLAYTDLFSLKKDMFEEKNGKYILKGERQKTGGLFFVVLLPPAVEILKKYDWQLPYMTNQQYNMRLKIVAESAGIDRQISSHWLRRSTGMFLLNNGFSIEVVAKVLGHKNIQTTQKAYAHILNKTVEQAFDKLMKK